MWESWADGSLLEGRGLAFRRAAVVVVLVLVLPS